MYTYVHRFNNHILSRSCTLYRIADMATSVIRVMKMGNSASRVGIETTSLALWASVLTPPRLPDVTTLPTSNCLWGSLPDRSVQTTTLGTSGILSQFGPPGLCCYTGQGRLLDKQMLWTENLLCCLTKGSLFKF